MPSLYLSPSAQEHNTYITGGSEEYWMNKFADIVEPLAKYNGITVYRNKPTMTLAQIIADSNAKKADVHGACHTNAGGGKGTVIFYSEGSVKGKRFAECIYNEIAPLTPSSDRGVIANNSFGELIRTNSVASLVEIVFHDNLEDATYMTTHLNELAKAYVKGLCKYFGLIYRETTSQPIETEVKGVSITVKNLVVYGNSIDKRAAEYLADYLGCATLDGNIPYDYTMVENVYCVGGEPKLPWTGYATKKITGVDRYDTMIQVLKFIGKI